MVSCHCFLLFSVVLRSVQLSLPRFAVLGNHQCLVCVLALLPSLTLTSCRVLGNRQVFYLSTASCNFLVEFWAIEHLQLSFGSLDLVRSSYSPGLGSGRPPHLHQVNRCLLPRNRLHLDPMMGQFESGIPSSPQKRTRCLLCGAKCLDPREQPSKCREMDGSRRTMVG